MLRTVWAWSLVLVVLGAALVHAARDYYDVLGVGRRATEREIKSAYRQKARHMHPDKHPEQADAFMEVTEAYQTLSDKDLRAVYDRYGAEAAKQHQAKKDNGHASPMDMFREFFGGGMADATPKGPSKTYQAEVTLSDLYVGRTFTVTHARYVVCPSCFGSGAASSAHIHECTHCHGRGVQVLRQEIMPGFSTNVQMQCPHCQGAGRTIAKACAQCRGQKLVSDVVELDVEMEPGAREGHEYVFEGMADQTPDGDPGDVVVRVFSKTDTGDFRRAGHHLYYTMAISLREALLGVDRTLTHYDGHDVRVHRTEVTQPGFVLRVPHEGLPVPWDERDDAHAEVGDLFVEFVVVLPQLSAQQRAAVAELSTPWGAHTDL